MIGERSAESADSAGPFRSPVEHDDDPGRDRAACSFWLALELEFARLRPAVTLDDRRLVMRAFVGRFGTLIASSLLCLWP